MDQGTDPRSMDLSELLPFERVRQERNIVAAKKALDDAERAAHKAAQSVKDCKKNKFRLALYYKEEQS